MICRFNIGSFEADKSNDLIITYDQYGNKYFSFEDIEQKINIRANTKAFRNIETSDITCAAMSEDVVIEKNEKNIPYSWKKYQLPKDLDKKYRWANNIKNLNPMFLINNYTKAEDGTEEYSPENYVVYIAIESPRYKILGYYTKYAILNTFTRSDKFTGATIVFTEDEHLAADDDKVIEIKFFDNVTKVYRVCTISIDGNGNPEMDMRYAEGPEVGKLKTLNNRYKFSLKMRIRPLAGSLITQHYIFPVTNSEYEAGSDDPEKYIANSEVEKLVSDHFNNNFPEGTEYYMSPIHIDENGEPNVEELEAAIGDIVNFKSKVFTTFGVKIPYDLIKKYKIKNVFNYDLETNKITLVK